MKKRIWLVVSLGMVVAGCSDRSAAERAQAMAAAYSQLIERYDLANDQLNAKMRRSADTRSADTFIREHERITAEKRREMEKLLDRYPGGSDSLELVRSKVLIEIGRFDEAETIIDRLIDGKGKNASEARLQKALLHLMHRRTTEAAKLVTEIEPVVAKDAQFYNLCLVLAFSHPDLEKREEFSRKLIDAPELPARIKPLIARIHANLAMLAKERNRTVEAMAHWDKALALESDPELRAAWEGDRKQIAMIHQPPPPLNADNWLNGPPVNIINTQGRVVVIDFWAPWCAPCRQVAPILQEQHRLHRGEGLLIIGYTRLYGRYYDDLEKREKTTATEELSLIRKYVDRNQITYPIAVATEGAGFAAYSVTAIPTLIFIDRKGKIAYFKTGAGSRKQIEDKIAALLSEKP